MAGNVHPLGTVGLGFVPPSRDMLLQAGALSPADTVLGCLQQLVDLMSTLQQRLAPPQCMIAVPLDGLAVGGVTDPVNITNPSFNGFLVTVSAGTLRVYLGGPTRGFGFIDLPAAAIPYHIHIPQTSNNQATFKNIDPVNACVGTIYIMSY